MKKNDIKLFNDPYDDNCLVPSLHEFEPPEEIALRIYITFCKGSNLKNRMHHISASEITLKIVKKLFKYHWPELNPDHAQDTFKTFQTIFNTRKQIYSNDFTIKVLSKIQDNIQSDIFYDMRWDNANYDESAIDQVDMKKALQEAIKIIK